MNSIAVHGVGAVSPAGWGVPVLRDALANGQALPTTRLARPGWERPLLVRQVPPPGQRPAFFAHARLRRASPITQYTVAAAMEALGDDAARAQTGSLRLGIVVCVLAGSVAYSRRFYEETSRDPATASPVIFPETVFNAPASHLAAYLGSTGASCTVVGDDGAFLQGLAMASDWLLRDEADGCIVVGAEEMDWIVSDAVRLFHRDVIQGDGAGAIYIRRNDAPGAIAALAGITDAFPFTRTQSRIDAARRMRAQFPAGGAHDVLCLGTQGLTRADAAELAAWEDWRGARFAPKETLGQAFTASAAWQCVAACDGLRRGQFTAADVSIVGVNQQAIGARFLACSAAGYITGSSLKIDGRVL